MDEVDGVHDLGGMQDFGPVLVERSEPVFHASWEARVFGIGGIVIERDGCAVLTRTGGTTRPDSVPDGARPRGSGATSPAPRIGGTVADIRDMDIEWDSYNTSLRKGYLVDLFEKRGIFDEFKAKHWLLGNTTAGEKERQRLLRIKEQYEAFLAGHAPQVSPDDEAEDLLFPLESHLRDFIASNIGNISLYGRALRLY